MVGRSKTTSTSDIDVLDIYNTLVISDINNKIVKIFYSNTNTANTTGDDTIFSNSTNNSTTDYSGVCLLEDVKSKKLREENLSIPKIRLKLNLNSKESVYVREGNKYQNRDMFIRTRRYC